ncbi:TetR/AcrR family transcriptional regulator [Mycobacterium sp. OTB74]|uniref:TetR/AcrR family transcriptional regulator n=1 Tax=Mycobacterium sp. OTB74 TaxID=1853452 RepID=UPI0024760EC1|nr:TetR/AcrR family transcriptional regulator [Mycobacterium sp. OTB74]MDH6243342.1 AcrR family transcriptional regulator [Mycobacterium sp. OTB74]
MAKSVSPRGSARARVIDAALVLFAEHGVNGTSLQMIADHLGVSKASVYYQFHCKDDIVLAVIRPMYAEIDQLITEVEASPAGPARRKAAVAGLVELAVRHRRVTAIFYRDPAIDSLVSTNDECDAINQRFKKVLGMADEDTRTRVAMSLLIAGIYGSAMDPGLQDVPDSQLEQALLESASQISL